MCAAAGPERQHQPQQGSGVTAPGEYNPGMGWSTWLSACKRALHEAGMSLIPFLLLWTMVELVRVVLVLAKWGDPGLWKAVTDTSTQMGKLLPVWFCASMASLMAIQWRMPRIGMAIACTGLYVATMVTLASIFGQPKLAELAVAIMLPPLFVPLVARMVRSGRLRLLSTDVQGGLLLTESMNLVLPAMVAFAAILAGVFVLGSVFSTVNLSGWTQAFIEMPGLVQALVFSALNSVLWTLGIHGYYALLPMLDIIQARAIEPGELIGSGFLGSFVFIGGSGATLSLVITLWMLARSRSERMFAVACLSSAFVNINEIVLYGIPIIWNWRMFLPFLLVPLTCVLSSYAAMRLGLVPPASTSVPFNAPVIFNALISTGWHPAAAMLQVFNVAVGAVIYWPFAKRWLLRNTDSESIYLAAIDSTFVRRQEHAVLLVEDPISRAAQRREEMAQFTKDLRAISQLEFQLHFQPIVSSVSGMVVGAEALLRLVDRSGHVVYPAQFMPLYRRAGLLKDMDLWALQAGSKALLEWRRSGLSNLRLGLNVTPDSLIDKDWIRAATELCGEAHGQVLFEITEEALLREASKVQPAIERLRAAGALVYIDDFGTGYSSLSYLHRFQVDGIKIDASFVRALNNRLGQQIFRSIVDMAHGLSIGVTVEGVEKPWQLSHMPSGDETCNLQGWYFSTALPAEDFIAFVRDRSVLNGAANTASPKTPPMDDEGIALEY